MKGQYYGSVIKFLCKGMYRADVKGWPRSDIMSLWRADIKFLSKGLFWADMNVV